MHLCVNFHQQTLKKMPGTNGTKTKNRLDFHYVIGSYWELFWSFIVNFWILNSTVLETKSKHELYGQWK